MYTKAVDRKFYRDGTVRRYPGTTIVCKVPHSQAIFSALIEAQRRLKGCDAAWKYVFLPPASFHMTVFDGLCDQRREPERWSSKLDLQLPMDQANAFLKQCLDEVPPPETLEMCVASHTKAGWLGIALEPADAETFKALQHFRNRFSRRSGIRLSNHEHYVFHITLAYQLVELAEEELESLQAAQDFVQQRVRANCPCFYLNKPQVVAFEDMLDF